MKKFAMVFATLGLALTLIGAGLSATFTASATSTDYIQFGTLALSLTDLNPGCTGNPVSATIACVVATNQGGNPGSIPVSFKIKNVGSTNAADVSVSYSPSDGNFSVLPAGPYSFGALASGAEVSGTWTVSWPSLGDNYQGATVYVVFNVSASA